jgi:hypothetical protein
MGVMRGASSEYLSTVFPLPGGAIDPRRGFWRGRQSGVDEGGNREERGEQAG